MRGFRLGLERLREDGVFANLLNTFLLKLLFGAILALDLYARVALFAHAAPGKRWLPGLGVLEAAVVVVMAVFWQVARLRRRGRRGASS